jgi:SP family facilitated glucose transporter-like MFS transporter 3
LPCFDDTLQALNAPQRAISCTGPLPPNDPGRPHPFPPCIRLSLADYGLVTSAFVLGGLLSCISTSTTWTYLWPTTTLRKRFALCATIAFVGELFQSYSTGFKSLAFGRLVTGFGAAGGMGLVPPALGELAPPSLKGSIGVLHQLAIVVGIVRLFQCARSLLGLARDLPPSPPQSFRLKPSDSGSLSRGFGASSP